MNSTDVFLLKEIINSYNNGINLPDLSKVMLDRFGIGHIEVVKEVSNLIDNGEIMLFGKYRLLGVKTYEKEKKTRSK